MFQSDFLDRNDSYKEESFLKNFSDGLTKDDSWLHMLIANNSVLLVVLLHFHTNFVDEICHLVDGQFVNCIV